MRRQPIGNTLVLHLLSGLAKRHGLRLREDVCKQHVVMPAKGVEWTAEGDEVARDEPGALMDELIERMLAVSPRLAPVDLARIVFHGRAIERHALAITFHGQLLQVGRKAL